MAKYKVLTIALAVKNNRVARFGEEVSESELTVNPSELVKSGALELLESVEEPKVDEKPLTAKDKAQAGLKK